MTRPKSHAFTRLLKMFRLQLLSRSTIGITECALCLCNQEPDAPNVNTTARTFHEALFFSLAPGALNRIRSIIYSSFFSFPAFFPISVHSLVHAWMVWVWLWQKSFPAFETTMYHEYYVHKSCWSSFNSLPLPLEQYFSYVAPWCQFGWSMHLDQSQRNDSMDFNVSAHI